MPISAGRYRAGGFCLSSDAMHEVGIMSSAIRSIIEQVEKNHARRVHRVVLKGGALSGAEPEALRFAFDIVTQDTVVSGATLDIQQIPARALCTHCKAEFGPSSGYIFECPTCKQFSGSLVSGRELELSQLEMS